MSLARFSSNQATFGSSSICALLLVLAALFALGCSRSSPSATQPKIISSSQFGSLPEQIEALAPYYQVPTEVKTLDYEVRVQDNSGGLVPGPSDWSVMLFAKVQSDDLQKWTQGATKQEETGDISWARLPQGFEPTVAPSRFSAPPNIDILLFEQDDLVSLRLIRM
jgi:hypothetical protein